MSDPFSVRPAIERGLAALGLALAPAQVERLVGYLALLARWNATYNLTAIRDPAEMVVKHLNDSLAVLPFLAGDSLADLGSGAGLPGVPLAIAAPARRVVLVESNGKKARFLRECVRALALANVRVVEARAEAPSDAAPVAEVTARALAPLPELVRLAAGWLAPDGRLLAMKGPGHDGEVGALPSGWSVDAIHRLAVPGLDGDRVLVVVKRSPDAVSGVASLA